jgi:hypothetical protein
MTPMRRILAALSSVVLMWGITFTAVSLAWTKGLLNRAVGISIGIALAGACGLLKALRSPKKVFRNDQV